MSPKFEWEKFSLDGVDSSSEFVRFPKKDKGLLGLLQFLKNRNSFDIGHGERKSGEQIAKLVIESVENEMLDPELERIDGLVDALERVTDPDEYTDETLFEAIEQFKKGDNSHDVEGHSRGVISEELNNESEELRNDEKPNLGEVERSADKEVKLTVKSGNESRKELVVDVSEGGFKMPEDVKSLEDLVNYFRTIDRVDYKGGAVTGQDLAERIIDSANQKKPEAVVRMIEGLPSVLDKLKKEARERVSHNQKDDEIQRKTEAKEADIDQLGIKGFPLGDVVSVLQRIAKNQDVYTKTDGSTIRSKDVAKFIADTIEDRREAGGAVPLPKEIAGLPGVEKVIDEYTSQRYKDSSIEKHLALFRNWQNPKEKREEDGPNGGNNVSVAEGGKEAEVEENELESEDVTVDLGIGIDLDSRDFDAEREINTIREQLTNYRTAFSKIDKNSHPNSDKRLDLRLKYSEMINRIENTLRGENLRARAEQATNPTEKRMFIGLAEEAERVIDKDYLDKTHDAYVVSKEEKIVDQHQDEKEKESRSVKELEPQETEGLLGKLGGWLGVVSAENASELKEVGYYKDPNDAEKDPFEGFAIGDRVQSVETEGNEYGLVRAQSKINGEPYLELDTGELIPVKFAKSFDIENAETDGEEDGDEDESILTSPERMERMLNDEEFMEFLSGGQGGVFGEFFNNVFSDIEDVDRETAKKNIREVLVENEGLASDLHEKFIDYTESLRERYATEDAVIDLAEDKDLEESIRKMREERVGLEGDHAALSTSWWDLSSENFNTFDAMIGSEDTKWGKMKAFGMWLLPWDSRKWSRKRLERRIEDLNVNLEEKRSKGELFSKLDDLIRETDSLHELIVSVTRDMVNITRIYQDRMKQELLELFDPEAEKKKMKPDELIKAFKKFAEIGEDAMTDEEREEYKKKLAESLGAVAEFELKESIANAKTLSPLERKLGDLLKIASKDKQAKKVVVEQLEKTRDGLAKKDKIKAIMIGQILTKLERNKYE